jgi:hypothetical protein
VLVDRWPLDVRSETAKTPGAADAPTDGYALGGPARTPVSEVLLEKARQEIGLGLGHALEARPIRISIVVAVLGLMLLLGAGVVAESGQPAVAGAGPLVGETIQGPLKAANKPNPKTPSTKQIPPGQLKKP